MLHTRAPQAPAEPLSLTFPGRVRILRRLRRDPFALQGLLLSLVAVAALAYTGVSRAAQSRSAAPADLFMQSVITRDGALGWRHLCGDAQAQVPLALVRDQAAAQRVAEAGLGLTLTVDRVGVRPRSGGGEVRVYVVTAHRPDGSQLQRTYTLTTQASGCVAQVE